MECPLVCTSTGSPLHPPTSDILFLSFILCPFTPWIFQTLLRATSTHPCSVHCSNDLPHAFNIRAMHICHPDLLATTPPLLFRDANHVHWDSLAQPISFCVSSIHTFALTEALAVLITDGEHVWRIIYSILYVLHLFGIDLVGALAQPISFRLFIIRTSALTEAPLVVIIDYEYVWQIMCSIIFLDTPLWHGPSVRSGCHCGEIDYTFHNVFSQAWTTYTLYHVHYIQCCP